MQMHLLRAFKFLERDHRTSFTTHSNFSSSHFRGETVFRSAHQLSFSFPYLRQTHKMPASSTDNEALFEQAKAYLMQADEHGESVYDMLYKTVYSMMEENPEDVANHPEKLSDVLSMLKRHQFRGNGGVTMTHSDARGAGSVPPSQSDAATRNLSLLERPKPEVKTTITQPTPDTTVTTTTIVRPTGPAFASVAKDNSMWRYCGAGIPEQEAFLLDQSIAKLARDKKLSEVRFVGKVFGLTADYVIVSSKRYVDEAAGETIYKEANTMPKAPRKKTTVDVQPEGAFAGCNRLSFWVAANAASEWVLLPDTTPQLVNSARVINKLFTGDLDAPVVTHPAFLGVERDYLRAQLSRIVSATYISPAGALERPEEEEDEEDDVDEDGGRRPPKPAKYVPATVVSKEYQPDIEAGVAALADLEQWVHSEGYIYRNGRQTKIPPKPENEEEDEEQPEEDDEEEGPNPLTAGTYDPNEEEEEEREMFQPIKRDVLHAVVNLPKEPNPEEEEEEADEEEPEEQEGEVDPEVLAEREREQEMALKKPVEDEEIADDDPLKKKITAWTAQVVNAIYKKHGVVAVRSVRWPGAIAFAGQGGKTWGSVYLGNGLKNTDFSFVPPPAPLIQQEVKDVTEVADPTAANEKLVLRGEEPKEEDSELEQEDEEEEDM